jgi:hypothetical protein
MDGVMLLCDDCDRYSVHEFLGFRSGYLGAPKFVDGLDRKEWRLAQPQNVMKEGRKGMNDKATEHLWKCRTCGTPRRYGLT